MSSSHPSIQSFFKREVRPLPLPTSPSNNSILPSSSSPQPANPSSPNRPGDGFTPAELAAAQDPLNCVFNPTREYEEREIGTLETGSRAVCFVGRVVNFSVTHGKSKSQGAARGWVSMVVKDQTGAIAVSRLPYSRCNFRVWISQLPFWVTSHLATRVPLSSQGAL